MVGWSWDLQHCIGPAARCSGWPSKRRLWFRESNISTAGLTHDSADSPTLFVGSIRLHLREGTKKTAITNLTIGHQGATDLGNLEKQMNRISAIPHGLNAETGLALVRNSLTVATTKIWPTRLPSDSTHTYPSLSFGHRRGLCSNYRKRPRARHQSSLEFLQEAAHPRSRPLRTSKIHHPSIAIGQ